MRQLVALVGLVWAVLNVALAGLFLASSFTAKTLQKEGILAQLALLFGGALIATFGVILAWQAWKLLRHATVA
jgi:hypothetical protein